MTKAPMLMWSCSARMIHMLVLHGMHLLQHMRSDCYNPNDDICNGMMEHAFFPWTDTLPSQCCFYNRIRMSFSGPRAGSWKPCEGYSPLVHIFFVPGEDCNLLCRRWTSTLCRTKLHPHKLWLVCGEAWFWNQPFLNGVPCSIQSPLHLDLWCLISAHTHRIVQALAHHSAKVWLVPLAKIFFCFPAGLKHHLHRYFFLMLPNCDDMGFLHLLMSLHGPSQEHCVGFELQPVTLEPKKHTQE